jgi:hypothetical protein
MLPGIHVLTAIHVLFGGVVATNLVYYIAIIAGYRKLAHG